MFRHTPMKIHFFNHIKFSIIYSEIIKPSYFPLEKTLQRKIIQFKGFKYFLKGPIALPRIVMESLIINGLELDVYSLGINIYKCLQLKI